MKALKFNTGRQYTRDGQIIVAWLVDGREDECATVRFFDVSRNITGEINAPLHFVSQRHIMELYDNGHYKEVSHMPGVEEEKAQAIALTA